MPAPTPTTPTALTADPYSRDVLRSVADQLTALADYHYRGGECTDAAVDAVEALDSLRNGALGLIGEVHHLRNGEPYEVGTHGCGGPLPCGCNAGPDTALDRA